MCKLFLILILFTSHIFSQSSYLPYGYQGLNSQFFGENIGYYVTKELVYKTTDSGKNWETIYKGDSLRFYEAFFVDENNFWITLNDFTKSNRKLLHSSNGGISFDLFSLPEGWINDISFCDSVNGWILIEGNYLFKTSNAGATWSLIYTFINASEIQLVTKDVGYVNDYFHLLRTGNGGYTFSEVNEGATFHFSFVSKDTGIISYYQSSNFRFFTTFNGGFSWTEREPIINGALNYLNYFPNHYIIVTGNFYNGGGYLLWISTDEGSTWNKYATNKYINEISLVKENLMYGVVLSDHLYKSSNNGVEWTDVPVIPPIKFIKIEGNSNFEWAIGSYFDSDSSKTNSYLFEKGQGDYFTLKNKWYDCKLTSLNITQTTAALIGGFDIPSNANFVLKTTDSGNTWFKNYLNIPGSLNSFFLVDHNFILAAGNNGTLCKSSDAGESWEQIDIQTNANLNAICGLSNLLLAAGDSGVIFRSLDFGNSWMKINVNFTDNIKSLNIENSSAIWGVGSNGLITVSHNGGLDWLFTRNSDHEYESIKNYNLFGFLVGQNQVNDSSLWAYCNKPLNLTGWKFKHGNWGSINDIYPYYEYSVQADFACDNGYLLGSIYGLPVPVELSSFSAEYIKDNVILNWETATEINNLGFEIQRRCKDIPWHTVGFIKGKGNSTERNYYSFNDKVSGFNFFDKAYYRLKQIDYNGDTNFSEEVSVNLALPAANLEQNYPNPFNPSTRIKYSIPVKSKVELFVYDILGRRISSLVNEIKDAGNYTVDFTISDLASGVYFYSIKTEYFQTVKKMIFLK